MKIPFFFLRLFTVQIIFLIAYHSLSAAEQIRESRFGVVEQQFKNPSKDYRSAPLWVWNTTVTKADIDRMLKEFKDQGFGGAFVHPRPGMITEYLSQEWFDLYRYSVEVGKKLGLDIWIYDENSYPSGFAGGHVPAEMPESFNQGQGLHLTKIDLLPDNLTDYYMILKREGETFTDITEAKKNYKGKKGDYYLYSKTFYAISDWNGGYSYVDLLYPGVTEKFLEITMDGYEKTFGDELGTVIKGIFTDEPNIASPGGIRWTPDLFEIFQKKWGYDLKVNFPLLTEEIGDWKRVRHNYLETMLQLFIDRWCKPWYEYTESKNLLWTGHYWEHGWPDVGHGPDNMAMYAWHQLPAIDMLFNQFNDKSPLAQFGNIRAVKELRSVANQMGYTRTLSETYGAGGWDVTFEDMKRLGDWEYVLGVNFMNQHLSFMTISGARKYDHPPVFTSLSPWWENYKSQNDYFGRLSLVLSEGEQLNDILILEPTTSVWLKYSYMAGHNSLDIGNAFQQFITRLEKEQIEYDLGSENIIKDHGSIENGKFRINKRSYSKVILPPMTENLNSETFELIKKFVEAGGELISFSIPERIDGAVNEPLVDFFLGNLGKIKLFPALHDEIINKYFTSDQIKFSKRTGNDLYHQRRHYDEGDLLFLVNSSLTEYASGEITIAAKTIYELDAMDGEKYNYPYQNERGYLKMEYSIPPAGNLLLFCSNEGHEVNRYKPRYFEWEGNVVKSDGETKIKRLQDNVLTLDYCNLEIDGKKWENLYVGNASDTLYRRFGFVNGNPWNTSVQYRTKIVDRDNFATGNIKVEYIVNIQDAFPDKQSFRLLAERPGVWSVKVNGKAVGPASKEYWLDPDFTVYNVTGLLEKGKNIIELSVNPMNIHAEIEPVYLLGDFSVTPASKGWNITAPTEIKSGSWKGQGLAYYPWDVSYKKDYRIDSKNSRYSVKLNEWKGSLAEVYVNGKKAGIIAYQPGVLDVTDYIKKGKNNIEIRVIGSLRNLLGPHYNNLPPGIAGPFSWKNVGEQIPGDQYSLLDYGLMDDFELIVSQ